VGLAKHQTDSGHDSRQTKVTGSFMEGGRAAIALDSAWARDDGRFPRLYVGRFVMGLVEHEDPDTAMPEFAATGLRHLYPEGGADGEVLERHFEDLLDYLAFIQD
jgi:hypothetical protein